MKGKTFSFCIVEPRDTRLISSAVLNIRKLYQDNPIMIHCGKNLKGNIQSQIKDNNTHIKELDVNNLTPQEHSDFFKNYDFWNEFETDYMMTIHTDGCLCVNSKYKLEDFLQYDYVGGYAPQRWWSKELHLAKINPNEYKYMCFNGGFTLRNVEAMKAAIKEFPAMPTHHFTKYTNQTTLQNFPEDLYFVCALQKIGYNVGRDDHSINFCTHTSFERQTFCIHKSVKYISKNKLLDLLNYCPDYEEFLNG